MSLEQVEISTPNMEAVEEGDKITPVTEVFVPNIMLLGDIKSVEPALRRLFFADLPIKTAAKLTKTIENVNNELEFIERQRISLVKKYGSLGTEGQYIVDKTKEREFSDELTDVFSQEVHGWEPIPLTMDELDRAGFKIKPVELALLTKFGFIE